MPPFNPDLPLSLYIHLPWCIRKCPYCDFNSHAVNGELPEAAYVAALKTEFEQYLPQIGQRPIQSIFFGGGTPSLFSAQALSEVIAHIKSSATIAETAEVTLEANPGAIDQAHFADYRTGGINRLSIGVQSFAADKLQTLGRIHDPEAAVAAVAVAKDAGFENFNLDIMYGLPDQTVEEAMADIEQALALSPSHFSWYQLTIEPNTLFHHTPPTLPAEETIWEMQCAGQALLASRGYAQYEVSAYAQPDNICRHNYNYWQFGDYLGIGAGAHSKLTDLNTGMITRFAQVKHPRAYLEADKPLPKTQIIAEQDLIFEFMLNALRLTDGVPYNVFSAHTGLEIDTILPTLEHARQRGLLEPSADRLKPTVLGQRFLNDLVGLFLPF